MGAYGAKTNKPSLLFGTPPHPQNCPVSSRSFDPASAEPALRAWLESLKCKLTDKDKARILKAKENKSKAMVIKKINKRGHTSV